MKMNLHWVMSQNTKSSTMCAWNEHEIVFFVENTSCYWSKMGRKWCFHIPCPGKHSKSSYILIFPCTVLLEEGFVTLCPGFRAADNQPLSDSPISAQRITHKPGLLPLGSVRMNGKCGIKAFLSCPADREHHPHHSGICWCQHVSCQDHRY